MPPEMEIDPAKNYRATVETSKGTIRFPLSEPVPARLIERIAKFRTKEVAEGEKAYRLSRA
jgi:uncharacterized protein YdhG (YjbR/CyaY superfamily)